MNTNLNNPIHNTSPVLLAEILTKQQLVDLRPELLTLDRITWLIRNRKDNGLATAKALVQIGRTFHIKHEPFVKWYLEYIEIAA